MAFCWPDLQRTGKLTYRVSELWRCRRCRRAWVRGNMYRLDCVAHTAWSIRVWLDLDHRTFLFQGVTARVWDTFALNREVSQSVAGFAHGCWMWGAMRCDGCDGCLVRPSSSWPSTILWGSEQASLGGMYIYMYIYIHIYLYKHVAQKGKAICVYHISTEMCVCVFYRIYIYTYILIYIKGR